MKRDDLLNLLDLGGTEAAPPLAADLAITAPAAKAPPSRSRTALQLDDWALRRGRDLLAENERLQGLALDKHAIADFHGCAFEPEPKLRSDCIEPRRHEFIEQLLQTPEYKSLHTSTMLNEAASTIAAAAFAEQFAALKKEDDEPAREDETPDREMSTMRAVGKAVLAAREEVAEAGEAVAALGMGPGSPGSNDPHVVAALYRRVRNSPTLRKICELAGRYRRVAQSKQRRKTTHGLDDVVGVVMDGDLGRLLPHELAKLVIPEFEDDTLRRLVERQTQCREYRAMEPVAKGPIIVCIDESGSMLGNKGHTAKALGLGMAWVASQQRRWCALIAYSGDSGERLLPLPPGRWNETALMDWLEEFIGRGSDLDVPVREMPDYFQRLGAPSGDTDVLFITDAICRIPADARDRFIAWKAQAKARLVTLVISSSPGDLSAISDEVHVVQSLDVAEAGVERVLSV